MIMGHKTKCPECGEPMTPHLLPSKVVSLLAGRLEFTWYSYANFCVPCLNEEDIERRNGYESEIFNAGAQHGWDMAQDQLHADWGHE